ncbi:hypothetical protein BDW62DRAFT_191410 [Aspergillus aurantiobrunneus]
MLAISLILAAGSLFTLSAGAPVPDAPSSGHRHLSLAHAHAHSLSKRATYNVFGGAGQVAEGWPANDNWWPSFDDMFESNRDTMRQSCTQWDVPNNTDQEIDDIASAIKEVSSSSGVDPRFILAVVIQESNGCVRAPTSNNGVINPGLMQSHNGQGSCNDGSGNVQSPCPADTIKQMIHDGTVGTGDGAGLKGCLEQAGGSDGPAHYIAARIYNSGSVDPSGNLGRGIATHCYSSDIANRLTGWATGPSSCEPNTIGTLTKAVTSIFRFTAESAGDAIGDILGGGSDDSGAGLSEQTQQSTTTTSTTTTTTTTAAPAPTANVPAPEAPSQTVTSTTTATATSTSTNIATSTYTVAESAPTSTQAAEPPATTAPAPSSPSDAPIYPNASDSCQEYYTVESGDYCLSVESEQGVSVAQLRQLNPGLDEDCTNLWLGYQYCIKA